MTEPNETPEAQEKTGGQADAEQDADSGQPQEVVQPESVGQQSRVGTAHPTPEEISRDAQMWAMFCHLAGLAWLLWWIVPIIGGVIGALIMWQIKKDTHPFIDEQGKEAFNFQTSMLIYWAIAVLLCFTCIGFVLLPLVMILDIVFAIIAAVKANNGFHYRYPLTIRFIK
ncbi:MAG: DUF4870 domain-containing protein [Sedimentisphaerales bacterium]